MHLQRSIRPQIILKQQTPGIVKPGHPSRRKHQRGSFPLKEPVKEIVKEPVKEPVKVSVKEIVN